MWKMLNRSTIDENKQTKEKLDNSRQRENNIIEHSLLAIKRSKFSYPTSLSITSNIGKSLIEKPIQKNRLIQKRIYPSPSLTINSDTTNTITSPIRDFKTIRISPHINILRGSPKETYKMISRIENKQNIYYLATVLLVLCALSSTAVQYVSADGYALSNLLQKMKISPEIIKVPSYVNIIRVELNGNVVKPGDPVPARNFKDLNMAKISWDVNSEEARHTLILLDLDRKPNNTNIYNQFTSINLPGHFIGAGQNIVAFEPPVVPCSPNTKHRILMLAFHQEQNIDLLDVAYMAASSGHSPKRENFKLADFIRNHRLDLVAANVFQATGESGGLCNGASRVYASQWNGFYILIAMVMATIMPVLNGRISLIH